MPESFDLAELALPDDSPCYELLGRCPEARPLRFEEGELLMREGDASKEVFLVLRGAYVVVQPTTNQETQPHGALAVAAVQDPDSPSFVGEMAYLGGGLRTASVRSSGWTHALRLEPAHLDVIIEEFPVFTRILCRQFAERLKKTTEAAQESQELFEMESEQLFKEPGETLFRAGDEAETLYQLVDGKVVRESSEGEATLTPRKLFLGMLEPEPFFRDGCYRSTVRTETRCIVVGISRRSKLAVIRSMPELVLECLGKGGE